MTQRDRKNPKTQDAKGATGRPPLSEISGLAELFGGRPDGRSLGDLLGDPEWLARWELEKRRQADELEQDIQFADARRARWAADEPLWIEKLRPWAEKKGSPVGELLRQQPYVTLIGLARLADEDPAEVIQRYEKGDVPSKVFRSLLGLGKRKPGPRDSRVDAERWRVVHELRVRGYKGPKLDEAIAAAARPHVSVEHYKRCAAGYHGDKDEALLLVSAAIKRACAYPPLSRQQGA